VGALFLSAGTSFSQYDGPQNVILLPIGSIFRPIRQGARVDREATDRPAPDLAKAFFGGVTQPPATTSLRVEVPTLVVWGMKDPYQLPGLRGPRCLCA
jgi:pimeloyl-ACP methyl ester carboxylesterase